MGGRTDIWTLLIITAVALTVWFWAAAEILVERPLSPITVDFVTPGADEWSIEPESTPVTIIAEGSQFAIREASQVLKQLSLDLVAEPGKQTVDLVDKLRAHPAIRDAGLVVISTSPVSVAVTLDRTEHRLVRVRPVLPGVVQTDGDIVVEPAQVMVTFPGRLMPGNPDDLIVEAVVDRSEIDRLSPGIPHRLENVALRLPRSLARDGTVRVEPAEVALSFTIRSQIRELALESPVRVQLVGPAEDTEFVVFEPKHLSDVTVSAPISIIERIESGDLIVLAWVHIKSSEKESRIERKRVAMFVAMPTNDENAAPVTVDARVGDAGETRPEIKVTITERDAPE